MVKPYGKDLKQTSDKDNFIGNPKGMALISDLQNSGKHKSTTSPKKTSSNHQDTKKTQEGNNKSPSKKEEQPKNQSKQTPGTIGNNTNKQEETWKAEKVSEIEDERVRKELERIGEKIGKAIKELESPNIKRSEPQVTDETKKHKEAPVDKPQKVEEKEEPKREEIPKTEPPKEEIETEAPKDEAFAEESKSAPTEKKPMIKPINKDRFTVKMERIKAGENEKRARIIKTPTEDFPVEKTQSSEKDTFPVEKTQNSPNEQEVMQHSSDEEKTQLLNYLIPPKIVIVETGKTIEIRKPYFTIGRSKESDLTLSPKSVSRKHASVIQKNGEYYFKDEGSSNGSMINDRRLEKGEEVILKDSDVITLADYKIVYTKE